MTIERLIPRGSLDLRSVILIGSQIIIYYAIYHILPKSISSNFVIRTLFILFITGIMSRTGLPGWLLRTLLKNSDPLGRSSSVFSPLNMSGLQTDQRQQVLGVISGLDNYLTKGINSNDRHRRLYNKMITRHRNWAVKAGYLKKIDAVDEAIRLNSYLTNDLTYEIKKEWNIKDPEVNLLKNTKDVPENYQIAETLGHYVRDWCDEGYLEVKPLIEYVTSQLNKQFPKVDNKRNHIPRNNIRIIIPGSGVGRIAHEIATMESDPKYQWGSVEAVELSWLMHFANKFVYMDEFKKNDRDDTNHNRSEYEIYPFIQNYSNHVLTNDQTRNSIFRRRKAKPKNLKIKLFDFRNYLNENENETSKWDATIVVSVFFLDTAENMFEYIDAISALTTSSLKSGIWINAGPLKYGTAARIEFTLEELINALKIDGWEMLDKERETNPILGYGSYLGDSKSLWGGNYGIIGFTTKKKPKKR